MNRYEPPDAEPDFEPAPELADRLDEKVVSIPCYEPCGLQLDLTGRALVTHTALLGQSGSGKTSIIRWYIKGLIQHHAQDLARRPAVFIFDLNGDDGTVGLVRKWAAEAGRSDDVRLLTATSGHLDLFANIRSFEHMAFATAQFMHGAWSRDSENGYWAETARSLIDAALSICLVVAGRLETDTVIRFLTNWLIAKRPNKEDENLLQNFETMYARAGDHLDRHLLAKLEHVRATLEMWSKLDSKTRGILASCLLDALGPLIALETRRYLDCSRGGSFVPEEITDGRIMVFSVSAARNLESARLLGRVLKARLYVALQDRAQDRNQRLCAIIADEYHYLASGGTDRSSDVTALATLRSRSVALIAGTQSLDHLSSVMTPREFRSLLPNFGNHIFLRSTESSTGAFATTVMGTRQIPLNPEESGGDLMVAGTPNKALEFVCPPGALAALEPCQAYVSTSTGFRSSGMIWLAANHDSPGVSLNRKEPSSDVHPLQHLRDAALSKPLRTGASPMAPALEKGIHRDDAAGASSTRYYDLAVWHRLMREPRFQRTRFSSFGAFRQALDTFGHRPTGLETLPVCWWSPVAKLTVRFTQAYPMKLLGLHQVEGCLEVLLSGTEAPPETYLGWIKQLQKSLYPIRTRGLKERDYWMLEGCVDDDIVLSEYDDQNEGEPHP